MISTEKKRYMFTLTKETTDELQALCKEIGLPPATISTAIDHMIPEMTKAFKKIKEDGTFNFKQMFEMIGDALDDIATEEVDHETNNKLGQRRK